MRPISRNTSRRKLHRLAAAVCIVGAILVVMGCAMRPATASGPQIREYDGELAPTFPPEVPLYPGDVVSSATSESGSWRKWFVEIVTPNVSIQQSIKQQFRAAGFTVEDLEALSLGVDASGHGFSVQVFISELETSGLGSGTGSALSYVVETWHSQSD